MSSRGRSAGRPAASRASRVGLGPRPDPAVRRERVREVVEPVVTSAGYDLEDLTLGRAGRRHLVRVVVDGAGGVTLDAVADVSRAISAALDAAEETGGDLFEGEYALEVGSPGVDRPLTLPRHWRRNVGRLVKVPARLPAPAGDRQFAGRVVAADDEGVVLDVDGGHHELSYDQLGPGRVQIEFSRPDDHGPDDDRPDDDVVDEDRLDEDRIDDEMEEGR